MTVFVVEVQIRYSFGIAPGAWELHTVSTTRERAQESADILTKLHETFGGELPRVRVREMNVLA